ncbi:MAG: hypothetical protein HYV27_05990 [Candidatus Hydrogenedentes bacterium]|nr:hypothetical protein [Candidatus Hydrogenedentota bacterium]
MIALLLHGLLSAATGNAKEPSLNALKEKLAQLKAERQSTDHGTTLHDEIAGPAAGTESTVTVAATPSFAELHERWAECLSKVKKVSEECPVVSRAEIDALYGNEYDAGMGTLPAEEIGFFQEYLDCQREIMDELLLLCEQTADAVLQSGHGVPESWEDLGRGFYFASRRLEEYGAVQAGMRNFPAAIETLCGRYDLSIVHTDSFLNWPEYITVWDAVDMALTSRSVEEAIWSRLLARLSIQRDLGYFGMKAAGSGEEVLEGMENMTVLADHSFFYRYPIAYAQNWAYVHVTTPLYNHDLEVFGRALTRLLDLTHQPYYEIRPALEQFYKDFDVEPNTEELRLIRRNSSWYYIVSLSRFGFMGEALRQSSIDTLRIAILLDRQQRATGTYPATLEPLADALGGSVPLNPLYGEAYIYERTTDGFRLGLRTPELLSVTDAAAIQTERVIYWPELLFLE